jgi:hypothetical protein
VTIPTEDTISAFGPARSTIEGSPLSVEELRCIDTYFRASLYMCLGMIYLRANPLLRKAAEYQRCQDPTAWPLGLGCGHGGEHFSESALIDERVFRAIEQTIELAPLHNPASVDGIRAARAYFGLTKPQVAVFDTAISSQHAAIRGALRSPSGLV